MITYRKKFFSRVNTVTKTEKGFKVEAEYGTFTVEGGTKLGGSRNEWFLEGDHISGYINVTGIIDALRVIDTM